MSTYFKPGLVDSDINLESASIMDRINPTDVGTKQRLINSGYVERDPFVLPPSSPVLPSIPVPPPPQDFASAFRDFQGTQPQTDYDALARETQAAADARMNYLRQFITGQAESQRIAARTAGQMRESGTKAGLGMSQGLNWSSTGQDELWGVAQGTLGEINKINAAESQSLADAEFKGMDQTAKDLATLREQRSKHETDMFDTFYKITNLTLQKQEEDRLATGAKTTEANQKRDDARAVLQNILSSFAGADLKDLPDTVKSGLQQIETEAGYPAGFIEQGLTSLKALKTQQDQQRIDDAAKKAQIDEMIRLALGTPRGVTVNIPGLGPVSGLDVPGTGVTGTLQQTPINDAKGNQVGYQSFNNKTGATSYFDMDGNKKKWADFGTGANLMKTPTEKPGSTGLDFSNL